MGETERYIPEHIVRAESSRFIVETPEAGDTHGYLTAVFDVGQDDPGWEGKKADVPVARVEYRPNQDGAFSALVKVEDGHDSHAVEVKNRAGRMDALDLEGLGRRVNDLVIKHGRVKTANLREVAFWLADNLKLFRSGEITSAKIEPYTPVEQDREIDFTDETNVKDADWLKENYQEEKDTDVDQRDERLLRATIGDQEFEFLQSGDMYFVLNNVPTIEVMDAAIRSGIMSEQEKADFISLEQEAELKRKTLDQYKRKGEQRGAGKDLRGAWETAPAHYEYDAVRRLYYLEIAGEPVMDEFERDYIELLGTNAARYDHAVLEIGFGMGISANAIQKELVRQRELAQEEGRAANPTHIIIEFNHEVAEEARKWAKRQNVPVVVLEGDWKEMIKQIPDGILTGALADPYPLNPAEKHKDAALTLTEIHRCLRPGGVASIYADSQYALSEDHAQLAREAGYKYIGTATTEFAKKGKNTGEYYDAGLRMAMPVLYKDGGTGSAVREEVALNAEQTRELIQKIFIRNPKQFREKYQLKQEAPKPPFAKAA